MSKEAMKLALKALTYADACLKKQLTTKDKHQYAQDLLLEAGTAIKEALAEQPAQRQEPYGWHTEDHLTDRSATTYSKDVADRWKSKGWPVTPFYTSPPAQPSKPLRGERFVEIARAIAPRTVLGLQETIPLWIVKYGRAIEAAHGIKGDT